MNTPKRHTVLFTIGGTPLASLIILRHYDRIERKLKQGSHESPGTWGAIFLDTNWSPPA